MRPSRWFLPEHQDLLRLLSEQLDVTVQGIDAFAAWAAGDADQAPVTRRLEHQADRRKRALLDALREAFTTPLEPEDLFALSRGIDWVLNHAKDVIGESEVMARRELYRRCSRAGEAAVEVAERVGYAVAKES